MRVARLAIAALLAGCGDNGAAPDAPSTAIADAAPDAPLMPCTAGIELIGQFTATSAGSAPQFPVVMPTVGHPDGFDIRVPSWHITHANGMVGDAQVVPDSPVSVAFTGYDAAALNVGLAPLLTSPDIGDGILLDIPRDVGSTVSLQIAQPELTVLMTVDCAGFPPRDESGFAVIAPFSLDCGDVDEGVTFSQFVPDTGEQPKLANGAATMQLVCD